MVIKAAPVVDELEVQTNGPALTVDALEKAFGEGPWHLDKGDLKVLVGMEAADPGNSSWRILKDMLSNYGALKVWVEND